MSYVICYISYAIWHTPYNRFFISYAIWHVHLTYAICHMQSVICHMCIGHHLSHFTSPYFSWWASSHQSGELDRVSWHCWRVDPLRNSLVFLLSPVRGMGRVSWHSWRVDPHRNCLVFLRKYKENKAQHQSYCIWEASTWNENYS